MQRLIVLAVLLSVTLGGSIVTARDRGRLYSPPLVGVFTTADGSRCTCLFGIQPGKTLFDDAIRMVEQHPLARQLFIARDDSVEGSALFQGINYEFEIVRISGSSKVIWALLTDIGGGQVVVGDFVGALGPPEMVYPIMEYSTYGVFYGSSHVRILATRTGKSQDIPISLSNSVIAISAYAPDVFPGVIHSYGGLLRPWRGFTLVRRYQNAPRIDYLMR